MLTINKIKSHFSDVSPLYREHDSVLLRGFCPALYICVSSYTTTGRCRTVTLDRALSDVPDQFLYCNRVTFNF